MEMTGVLATNNVVALEISSSKVKLAIGSSIGSKPILYHYDEESIPGAIKDYTIKEPLVIKKAIASLMSRLDESMKLKIGDGTVALLLPPYGLGVWVSVQQTNVINASIDALDVENVMSLVRKQSVPAGYRVADIIPDVYETDEGENRFFKNAPLHQKSQILRMKAHIHTVSDTLYRMYTALVEDAGLSIRRTAVAPYADSVLIGTDNNMPSDYFLVNIGAHTTSVSLVGNKYLTFSQSFGRGGNDLTEAIASKFEISYEEAEKLKIDYGYIESAESFSKPLISITKEDGSKISYYQKDLNEVISQFYKADYNHLLSNAINMIVERKGNDDNARMYLPTLPVIFVGGGSELFGLEKVIASAIGTRKIERFVPCTIGAREAKYVSLLGLIEDQAKNPNVGDNNYRSSLSLGRSHSK